MSTKKSILIADDMHECILPLLREQGYDPVYLPVIDREGILKIIGEFEGLIIRSKTAVNKELVDAGVNLKFVARAGAGMDKVDEDYLNEKGIKAINAPEGNRDALGEHATGLLLSLLHKISSAHKEIKGHKWDRDGNRGIELKGKVVGIYGVGNMGMSFAQKLRGFDCEIIGFDKFKGAFEGGFIKNVELDELMERTEILSLHIPLNRETRHLFDEAYLRRFKNLNVLLNTARGEILRTDALIKLLDDGTLYGAGLDVLENEKLHTYTEQEKAQLDKLNSFPNVLITPHVGGWTYESYQRISEVIAQKIKEEL
ncbi:NAD(P)-dependent oxidoreductase [Ekhidna sp. MALMAid0563]|uniref:NAD(P)-dependent oxidoreductase n=1 Tax=Ekhidna sp. MALMAid0563 TaxID=3143937 RepID=UPI0032DFB62C